MNVITPVSPSGPPSEPPAEPKVTTGPLPASRKVYVAPDAAPDLGVPVREIALTEGSGEPPLPVYDTTGVYTDPDVAIDVEAGLERARMEWVRERGGIEDYQGRTIQAVMFCAPSIHMANGGIDWTASSCSRVTRLAMS